MLIFQVFMQEFLNVKKGQTLKFKFKLDDGEILIKAAIDKVNLKTYTFDELY